MPFCLFISTQNYEIKFYSIISKFDKVMPYYDFLHFTRKTRKSAIALQEYNISP